MEYLYLIRCLEAYKIGVAGDVRSRVASLQTGNPYKLELVTSYGYPNAEFVERALHQKFDAVRMMGEWFLLKDAQIREFLTLCEMLGGVRSAVPDMVDSSSVTDEEVEEAEEVQEAIASPNASAKFDYAAMFADGWRIERNTNGRHVGQGCRYWCWRRGNGSVGKEYIYGGRIMDLPYPVEEMRQKFDGAVVEGS